MANEPLKGVAPQAQVPKPAASQQPVSTVPAATQQVAPSVPETQPAVEPMRERTQENFEKLLNSNQQLFQQQQAQAVLLQQLLQQQQQRQTPQAPAPTAVQPAAKVDPNDFIEKDSVTGEQFINETKLRATLSEIQARAQRAEETAQGFVQQAREQEKQRQEREAFTTYPELNPNDNQKYDREFSKKTRAFLTDSMLNPTEYGGRALSFKEAADIVRAGVQPTQQQVAQAQVAQVVEQTQQAVNATPTADQIRKEQAAASVANQPPQAQSEISDEQLRVAQIRTRQGDDSALAERLMHTDHIFGPNSSSGQPE